MWTGFTASVAALLVGVATCVSAAPCDGITTKSPADKVIECIKDLERAVSAVGAQPRVGPKGDSGPTGPQGPPGPPGPREDVTWSAAAGTFFGASFTFLFVRLGDLLRARQKRAQRHVAALMRLQDAANEYVNGLAEVQFRADVAMKGSRARALDWTYPPRLTIDRSFYRDIMSTNLLDRAMQFNILVGRYNRRAADFRRRHSEIQRAYMTGRSDKRLWADSEALATRDLDDLSKFAGGLDEKVRDLYARASLLVDQFHSRRARCWRIAGMMRVWPLTEQALLEERRRFDEGIAKKRQESREHAERLLRAGPHEADTLSTGKA